MVDADGTRARLGFARGSGVAVRGVRRVPPRQPTNTFKLRDTSNAQSCIRVTEGREPTKADVSMSSQLRPLIEEIGGALNDSRLTVPVETLKAVERAYSAAFPWPPWFPWLFEFLERARIAWYRRELLGTVGSDDVLEAGRAVLCCTRAVLADAEHFCPLVPRWLSAELVALLIQRLSFGRGGGPDRALSRKRIRDLLLHPLKMASYLRTLDGGEKLFSGVLEELARASVEAELPELPQDELTLPKNGLRPTMQHGAKAQQLLRLVDQVATAFEAPAHLVPIERLSALRRAYVAGCLPFGG
jgi:hypothetical protein